MCSSNSFWGENSWWWIIILIILIWVCCGQGSGGCGSCGTCGDNTCGGCGGRNISSLGIMTGDGSGVVRQNDSLKASITCCMSQTGSGSTHFVTTP